MRKPVDVLLALLLTFLLSVSIAAAEPPRQPLPPNKDIPPLPPDWRASFTIAESPQLSGRLAFSAKVYNYDRILVLDLENRTVEPLIDGPGQSTSPSWSPDGTMLAFVSTRDGNKEIYTTDFSGEKLRRLTEFAGTDNDPSWSPDGKKIAFARTIDASTSNIFTVDAGGGPATQMSRFRGKNVTPRWSPDGGRIAYTTNRFWPGWDVCVWNIARGVENCPLTGKESYCRPMWSKDGSQLLFSYGVGLDTFVGMLTFRGNEWQRLTNERDGREYDAVWSPDDRFTAFTAEREQGKKSLIMLYNTKTKTVTPLLEAPYPLRYLSWSGVARMVLEAKRAKGAQ